jgi:hypothetical protein
VKEARNYRPLATEIYLNREIKMAGLKLSIWYNFGQVTLVKLLYESITYKASDHREEGE